MQLRPGRKPPSDDASAAHSAGPAPLQRAYAEAIGVPLAGGLMPDAARAASMAEEEASFGTVGFDERGLTSGMKLHLLAPVRTTLAQWRQTRAGFDRELEPFRADLEALGRLDEQRATQDQRAEEDLRAVERRAASDQRYLTTREKWQQSKDRYDDSRRRHGNRDAVTWGGTPAYWLLLLVVFVAEWLINYDTTLQFFGIPAVAFGTTAVLGLLIAFAAHEHGMIWRQWSFRFSQARSAGERWSDARLLSLATLALLIVLAAAGWMRYIAAAKALGGSSASANLLGAEAAIDINPSRDVLVSLLANLGAWLAGCFISIFAHDPDPEHMGATRQRALWDRRYRRADAQYIDERKTIQARRQLEHKQTEAAAATRRQAVGPQADMIRQVDQHEAALVRALASGLRGTAETYRDALARSAAGREVRFMKRADGQQVALSPFDVRAMPIEVDEDFVRGQV